MLKLRKPNPTPLARFFKHQSFKDDLKCFKDDFKDDLKKSTPDLEERRNNGMLTAFS